MATSPSALLTLTLVLGALLAGPTIARAGEAEAEGFSVLLGVGMNDNTLMVRRDGALGAALVGDRHLTYFVGFSKVPSPIFHASWLSWLRWSLEGELTAFGVGKQAVERITDANGENRHNLGTESDVGTAVRGQTAYLTPALALFIGSSAGLYGYLGFGYGLGWAHLSGDYRITDGPEASAACQGATTLATVQAACPTQRLDVDRLSRGSSVIVGVGYRRVGFKIFRGGPEFTADGRDFQTTRMLGVVFFQLLF